jgi:hypothetical protein
MKQKSENKENVAPTQAQHNVENKLNSSFEDLAIVKPPAVTKPLPSGNKFAYEPALFPNRVVKQLTGKNWHDLSPLSKK